MGFLTRKEQEICRSIECFDTSKEGIIDLHQKFNEVLRESYSFNRKYKRNVKTFFNLLSNVFKTTFSKKEILKNKADSTDSLYTYVENNITYHFSYKNRNVVLKGISFIKNEKEYYISHGQLLEFKKDNTVVLYDLFQDVRVNEFKLVSFLDKNIYTKETKDSFIKYSFISKTEINKQAKEKEVYAIQNNFFSSKQFVYINLGKDRTFFNIDECDFYFTQNETLDIIINENDNDEFLNLCLNESLKDRSNYYYSRNLLKPTYSIKTNKTFLNEQLDILKMNYSV